MAKLLLTWRSYLDEIAGNLAVINDEANNFLYARGISDEEIATMAKLCFANWDAYQWLSGAMDGRVSGTAGAEEMKQRFPILSAALAAYASGWAQRCLLLLSEIDNPKDFCSRLTAMHPSKRDVPPGLNATSGVAYVGRLFQLAEIGIHGFRIAANIPLSEDLRTLTQHAERGRKILLAAVRGHVATYGDQDKKAKRWASYQSTVNELSQKNPALSFSRICELVAVQFGVSAKTVKRHTKRT